FAVGLSRQLYGKTMHSERPSHRMYEQWHPLGIVGVISAFNFPAAVWAWNAMVAAVCGDVLLWKPSELTPLTAVAMNKIAADVAKDHGFPGVFSLVTDSGPTLGKTMAADRRIPLISATGSCAMGRSVGEVVGKRLGRSLLELGGNNAIIIMDDADLGLVIPSVVFGAVGTAGQRCTSTRRLLVHKSIVDEVVSRLAHAYAQISIGDPTKAGTLMGPLIHSRAVSAYQNALSLAREQGGSIVCGGELVGGMPSDLYVKPTIVKISHQAKIVSEETFAPILYVIEVDNLEQALDYHNGVDQGLSSAIFTRNIQSAERFLSAAGSDCGIANVNIGTSGAEIGGAFGGEKDTGGGRESGSDSWKQYMRRQTNTINYSNDLPLAQGISFELPST
ncbi:MAG: aldehyde dehydrogenase family protein, partial [Bdellovibrionales bacterium]|nr:aldehyde dehydrogenase family protein [Bdellovibrionales bacterium]